MKRTSLAVLLLFALAGCARYLPLSLGTGTDALAAPEVEVLARQASTIERPWLKPAALDLAAPLGLDAVAALAVLNNPDLAALRSRAGVAEAQVFAAGLLPDPGISVGADQVLAGPDLLLNVVGALALNLQALHARAVTRERALAEARQVRLDLAWAEWQTAGEARIEAVRVRGLARERVLADAADLSARSLLERTLRAAGRGDLAGEAVQSARLAADDAARLRNGTERDLAAARLALVRLLGLPPETPLRLAATPPPATPLPAAALFTLARVNRTDLQALRAGYAAQEASVHKAVLDQFPTLALTVNANRDSAGNTLFGPAVDFTLPAWNRNQGGIAIEHATREALKAEYAARLFDTRAQIAAAVTAMNTGCAQRDTSLRALPALQAHAAASRRAAERGDLSSATAEVAEQALRDRRLLLAQLERTLAEQAIALELLSGTTREAWPQ